MPTTKKTTRKRAAKKATTKPVETKQTTVEEKTQDTAEETKKESCSNCVYSSNRGKSKVICRRYPAPAGVIEQTSMRSTDWCGEYKKL